MTIAGWILFVLLAIIISTAGLALGIDIVESAAGRIFIAIISLVLIIGLFCGIHWYFNNTASGQRALTDQKSELANGLNRTVTVYTADGNVIAQYKGIIDIEGNDGGYVLFDFEGKRYTYYNCFVESIADIGRKEVP